MEDDRVPVSLMLTPQLKDVLALGPEFGCKLNGEFVFVPHLAHETLVFIPELTVADTKGADGSAQRSSARVS